MTLEQIIEREQAHRTEGGQFGIDACKESIRFYLEHGQSLEDQLKDYVQRANEDPFFNKAMVLACWEMLQETKAEELTEDQVEAKGMVRNILFSFVDKWMLEMAAAADYLQEAESMTFAKEYCKLHDIDAPMVRAIVSAYYDGIRKGLDIAKLIMDQAAEETTEE